MSDLVSRVTRLCRVLAQPGQVLIVSDVLRFADKLREQEMPDDALVRPILISSERLTGLEVTEVLDG